MSPLHRTVPACLLKCQNAWLAAHRAPSFGRRFAVFEPMTHLQSFGSRDAEAGAGC